MINKYHLHSTKVRLKRTQERVQKIKKVNLHSTKVRLKPYYDVEKNINVDLHSTKVRLKLIICVVTIFVMIFTFH